MPERAARRAASAVAGALLAAGCGSGDSRIDLVARTPSGVTSLALAEGALWAGTGAGLVRLPAQGGALETFGEQAGLRGGLAQVRWVGAATRDLWLATAAGVARFSPSARSVARGWTARDGLGHDSARWAGEAGGAVWAGTIRGASRLEPGGGRWRTYAESAGLPSGHVYRLAWDGTRLWASCINGGLAAFDGARWRTEPQVHGLGNKYPYAIHPVAGGLWLGTAGGVNRWDARLRTWDEAVCADGYTEYCVYAVAEARGVLWFGTNYGLYRRDLASGAQRVLTSRDGLPSDEITALLADGSTLWIGTSGGIARTAL